MSKEKNQKQVSLAGVAQSTKKEKKKFRFPWKALSILSLLIVLLVFGMWLYDQWSVMQEEKPSLTAREMVEYTYTSDALAGKVSYYLLGVTGDEIGDPMDMLAVMCYDRQAKSVSVVQIPVATYIDKDNGFAVDTIGDVWSNPQPEVFCSDCRVRVPEEERDGDVHAACGFDLEERTGSGWLDLIRVINDQYGLPIDNYLIIPREGLKQLIDALDGVEVQLDQKETLADEDYAAGVHTLNGDAAVDYAITHRYKNTPATDRDRMIRQRRVLAALWQKIAACDLDDFYYVDKQEITRGILGTLMNGTHPIRFNTTSFGKARLLAKTEAETSEMKLTDALARFFVQMGKVPMDRVTFSILPGETAKVGTASVYSVNSAQTAALFNEWMNPYGLTLDEETVIPPQATKKPKEADLSTVTLDTMLPEVEETEEGAE